MSISEVQRQVLKILRVLAADPENSWVRVPPRQTAWLKRVSHRNGGSFHKVGRFVVYALLRGGYVERVNKKRAPLYTRDYGITEAGLEAVSDEG